MNRLFRSSYLPFVRAGVVAAVLVALPTVFAARPASAQNLFVAGSARQFGILNAATGAYTFIGNTSIVLAGLGVGSDGIVYAIDTSRNTQLYRVNTANASLTSVGTLGAFAVPTGTAYSIGLTNTSDGTLYAYFATGTNNNNLYTVNRTNAATSLVGPTGQRFDGGLGGDGSGGLFATSGDVSSTPNSLFSINRMTGTATAQPVTNAGYSQTFALGFSTAFFGLGFNGSILTINQATGAATQTGTYNTATAGNILAATTFVTTSSSAPEPGTLPLLGMGLASGLGIVARRRKLGAK